MPLDTYPDTDDLFDRIAEIQEIIVTTSKATKTPGASVDSLPYWFTVIRNISENKDQFRKTQWDFEIAMVLFREKTKTARTNVASIQQINTDMINTMKEFNNRRNLITPDLPTHPPNFIDESLGILCEGYIEDGEGTATLSGSAYVITFSYVILQSMASVNN